MLIQLFANAFSMRAKNQTPVCTTKVQKMGTLFSTTALKIMVPTLLIACFSAGFTPEALAQGQHTVTKTIVAGANAKVGEDITYEIAVGCNADPADCGSLSIVDNIASQLELTSVTAVGLSCMGACAAGQSGTITLTKPAFMGGEALIVQIKLRVKPGTPAGTSVGNNATATISTPSVGNMGPSKTTPTVSTTTGLNSPQWSTTKVKTDPFPGIQPGLGQDVSYRVSFCSDTLVGNEDLSTLTVTDTFPAGATVVNAAGGNVAGNTITWGLAAWPGVTLASLYAGGGSGKKCLTKDIILNYPAGTFPLGTTVVNNVAYSATAPSAGGP